MEKKKPYPIYRGYQYSTPEELEQLRPKQPPLKKIGLVLGLLLVVLIGLGIFLWRQHQHDVAAQKQAKANQAKPVGFNKKQYSINDPASIWVVVNKSRALNPPDYIPANLTTPDVPLRLSGAQPEMKMRADAAHALEQLFTGAAAQGIRLRLSSGYRSYTQQQQLHALYVQQQGEAQANRESAIAGHSEHQTGLSVDVSPANGTCVVEDCFATSPEGQWVAAHAHEYGFIIRYQKDKEAITGYKYEPWHIRYVGIPLAAELHKTGQTMEEFFGLTQ